MASVRLPEKQLSNDVIQRKQQRDNSAAIQKTLSYNPFADAINKLTPVLADAYVRREQLKKQAVQQALLQKSLESGQIASGLDAEQMLPAYQAITAREKIKSGGERPKRIAFVNPGDMSLFNELRQPMQGLDPNFDWKLVNLKTESQRAPAQQSSFMDSSDNTPLYWDVKSRSYLRPDTHRPPAGKSVMARGNESAVTGASRAVSLLPKVDNFFDKLNDMGEESRLALTPGINNVFYPEVNQFKNELKQVGFAFGGKQLTGTEENIIMGTFVPNALDNQESREAKREALKKYLSGQIDLYASANLLGAAGEDIKQVLKKYIDKSPANQPPAPPAQATDVPVALTGDKAQRLKILREKAKSGKLGK